VSSGLAPYWGWWRCTIHLLARHFQQAGQLAAAVERCGLGLPGICRAELLLWMTTASGASCPSFAALNCTPRRLPPPPAPAAGKPGQPSPMAPPGVPPALAAQMAAMAAQMRPGGGLLARFIHEFRCLAVVCICLGHTCGVHVVQMACRARSSRHIWRKNQKEIWEQINGHHPTSPFLEPPSLCPRHGAHDAAAGGREPGAGVRCLDVD